MNNNKHWTPEEKLEEVKNKIKEKAILSPPDKVVYLKLLTITCGPGPYDPTLMSVSDQHLILEKLEVDGFIENLEFQKNGTWTAWFEIPDSTRNKYSKNKTTNCNLSIIFDKESGILKIGDEEVKLGKTTNQYHLLQTFFEDQKLKKEKISFWDIEEDLTHPLGGTGIKTIRNTTGNLRRKIAQKTSIKDFIRVKSEEIKINPKYISDS